MKNLYSACDRCCIILLAFLTSSISYPASSEQGDNLIAFLFFQNPYDVSQRNLMRKQHLIVSHQLSEDSSLGRNIWGGNSRYDFIPQTNRRELHINDFSRFTGEKREEMMKNLTIIIKGKTPIYEDKKKVEELELALLKKSIWAKCNWVYQLPFPLDKDEQCTESELKFLLQR